ncbi:MAG: proton-conducting transporter membrane subunit, partial [Bacteroidia bacterium]|nr:proton-conducting transporter membrane subunit [Bacteroidia bacterium]
TFFIMVSIIGWVVIDFSKNYLWGDALHKIFLGRLIFTISVVQFLTIAGDMISFFGCWFLSDVGLRKLIALYENRKYALITEKKKFIISFASNFFMLFSFALLYVFSGQLYLSQIFDSSQKQFIHSSVLEWAAITLALSAIIKSANIPFHGWVLGMMEAPTPVSGLLHAGLLNAGPFLVIRFASIFENVSIAPDILILWGGLSAL